MKYKSEFKLVDQSCTRPVILTQFSLLYFISNFAFYFVFRELLRSQSNLEYHKPKSCMNEYPGNWTHFDQCKINPSFAAAGPQVSCNQLEQLKIESSAKFNTAQWRFNLTYNFIVRFWPASLLFYLRSFNLLCETFDNFQPLHYDIPK